MTTVTIKGIKLPMQTLPTIGTQSPSGSSSSMTAPVEGQEYEAELSASLMLEDDSVPAGTAVVRSRSGLPVKVASAGLDDIQV